MNSRFCYYRIRFLIWNCRAEAQLQQNRASPLSGIVVMTLFSLVVGM